jgi:hypothetical protein
MGVRDRLEQGLLGALWRLVSASPRLVLAAALLLAVASGVASKLWLGLDSDQDKLVSPDLPFQKRHLDLLENFGDQEYLYVVLETDGTPEGERQAILAAENIHERLRKHPEAVKAVHYKITPSDLGREVLLYADLEEVRGLADVLDVLTPAMAEWFRDGSLPGLLNQGAALLEQGGRAGATLSPELLEPAIQTLERLLAAVDAGLKGEAPPPGLLQMEDTDPRYFFTDNRRLLIMRILPAKDYATMDVIGRPLEIVRNSLEQTRAEFPDLGIGLTGRPVLAADEMETTDADMTRASVIAVLAVGLMFWAVMGGLRRPMYILAALLMAIAWTFGFALLAVGSLNLLSIVFALVLVGIGVDFGVHMVMRYVEAESGGLPPALAVQTALVQTGPSIVLGAATSVCAFYTVAGASFVGLAELGIIGGTGILLCLLAMLTVLPAELIVFGGPGKGGTTRLKAMTFLEPAVRRPGVSLGVIAVVSLALLPGLWQVRFNYNLLELQAEGLDSVEYERTLIRESEESTWYSVHTAGSLEGVRELSFNLEELPGVAKVESLLDYMPKNQQQKMELLHEARRSMRQVPLQVRKAPAPSNQAMETALSRLEDALHQLAETLFAAGALAELEKLQQALDAAAEARAVLREDVADAGRLLPLQRALEQDVQASAVWLHRVLSPDPVQPEDMPHAVRDAFVGKDGAFQIKATPEHNVWEFDQLKEFVAQLRRVDPDASGVPVVVLESSKLMHRTFLWAGGLTLLLVGFILWLNARSLKVVLLTMLPLLLGMFWLLELMGLFGLQFNLANFFAIPVLIAIGVDGGVHLLSRWREMQGQGSLFATSTPTAVSLSFATTMIGFGGLLLAHHQGLASLGKVMVLGSATGLLACLLVLPAALKIFGKSL